MRYDHVIWDWNGTLFDDVHLGVEVANLMLGRRGQSLIDVHHYREIFGFPVRDYYVRLGLDLDHEPFEVLAVEWLAEYESRWRDHALRRDAHDTTSALGERGMSQSVLSASERGFLGTATAHFGIDHRMSSLVGIDDNHAVSKLDHGIAHIEELDVPRDRVLLVGDTEHDFEVATAMGIDCALLEDGHAPRARLEATGAPVYSSLSALLGALD